jgi:hypothetical protein
MKQKQFLFPWGYLVVANSLFLSSCYPGSGIADPYIVDEGRQKENLYYVPSSPSTSLLTEKNDLSLSAMRSSGTKFTGVEIQTAYMPGKHFGITGSYSYAANKNGNPYGGGDFMKYNRLELGAGYVTWLSRGWHFETYAGFGNGKINNLHYTGSSRLNLTHFFLQPAIAVSNKKKTVQLGFVSRFEGVNFNVMDTSFNNDREPFSTSHIKSLYGQPFHVMWQPGFVFHFGWKHFLFHTGYSLSSDLTNPHLYQAKGNFSLGALLQLNANEKSHEKKRN